MTHPPFPTPIYVTLSLISLSLFPLHLSLLNSHLSLSLSLSYLWLWFGGWKWNKVTEKSGNWVFIAYDFYSFASLDPWVPGINDLMTTMNLPTVWATSLLIVLLHLLLFLSASSPPRVCPLFCILHGFLNLFMFDISFSDSVSESFLFAGLIRVYFSKTKPGLDPPHQAAIISATSATHAWLCKCLACPPAPAGWIRTQLCLWDFLTRLLKGTDTHFTSHWVGNAAVETTSSILRPKVACSV